MAFASHYLNSQEKKYSTNELELLAVVWSVDRFKHYLLGKESILATDHKALTSALGDYKSNKLWQSRLTRWVDPLLPYQIKVVHIPGKDMWIVDYLSRDPIREPWPESQLDEKFVVASVDQFHKTLDCLNNRLMDTTNITRNKNENILEHSDLRRKLNKAQDTWSHGCYCNRSFQNQIRLDWNKNGQNSRLPNCEQNTLSKLSHCKQSVDIKINKKEKKFAKEQMKKKSKKTVKLMYREWRRDQMLEQVSETTYQRIRTVQRGGTENDWDIRTQIYRKSNGGKYI